MTERERLIELISHAQYLGGLEEKIADHLLEHGVIVPPCKIGSTVYESIYCAIGNEDGNEEGSCELSPCSKCNCRVHWIIEKKMKLSYLDEIGISVFLTKEEAEKSLKAREK